MLHGYLAFWMDDALPFRRAPSCDMLPMLWSPGPQEKIIERSFNLKGGVQVLADALLVW